MEFFEQWKSETGESSSGVEILIEKREVKRKEFRKRLEDTGLSGGIAWSRDKEMIKTRQILETEKKQN